MSGKLENTTAAAAMSGGTSVDATDRFVVAIRRALQVLGDGGCPDCKCAGCSAEMAEAHRILREALGVS